MSVTGEIAIDTSTAIRFLNGDETIVAQVLAHSIIVLPVVVVEELFFGAENSNRPLQNLPRYLDFIETCQVIPVGRETATIYSQTRLALKRKGQPIPMNNVWIAAQYLEHG